MKNINSNFLKCLKVFNPKTNNWVTILIPKIGFDDFVLKSKMHQFLKSGYKVKLVNN